MPEPVVITNYDELLKTCGTKYTACPNILGVSTAVRKRKLTKVAFVGTPCQIQAVRKVQFDQTYDVEIDKIKFLIGLFCMESFTYKGLIGEFAEEKLSLAPEIIRKIDIKKGKLQIHTKGEKTISTPLEQLLNYVRESCHFCLDFTSELADVSVGAVGSKLGYSTVLTRTEIGEKIFNEAVEAGFIETKNAENEKPNLDLVRRLTEKKQKENLQKILEKSELTKLSYLSVPKDRLQNYFSSEIRYALEK
jgi:coenzyme F420 hydrogenase subunit beta